MVHAQVDESSTQWVTTMCLDGKKEQTNSYHRGGGTHPRCQFTLNRSAECTLITSADSTVTQRCYSRGHAASITIFLVHSSRPSPSPPWLARFSLRGPPNAFLGPSLWRSCICLSNDATRSDVCAVVPMSAQFNKVSTDTNWNSFLRYDSCIHNSLIERCRTFPEPVLVQIPRAALLSAQWSPPVASRSAPRSLRFALTSPRP